MTNQILWLDAGHGGKDAGAVSGNLYEKNIVLDIVKRMKKFIEDNYEGVTVKMTRDTDVFYSLQERYNMANRAGADLFISVHVNAGGGTGYEDYINKPLSDTSMTAKFRNLIHQEASAVLKKHGIKNRGKKKAGFAVLNGTKMSAVLVETLFIDNANDRKFLTNDDFIQEISEAYARGAARGMALKKKKTTPKPQPKPQPKTEAGKLHRVQVGAFSDKANAEKLVAQLKKAGFDGFIV